jgi:hypothetical protein
LGRQKDELSKEELAEWRSHFGTSNSEIMGLHVSPFAFTEYGILAKSSPIKLGEGDTFPRNISSVFSRMD